MMVNGTECKESSNPKSDEPNMNNLKRDGREKKVVTTVYMPTHTYTQNREKRKVK